MSSTFRFWWDDEQSSLKPNAENEPDVVRHPLVCSIALIILTVGFQRHRLGELSRHGLVARLHSERHVPGIKAQTLDTKLDH